MAAITFPLNSLLNEAAIAKQKTFEVIEESRNFRENVLKVIRGTVGLKGRLERLAEKQGVLIAGLVDANFDKSTSSDLADLASRIEAVISNERAMLDEVDTSKVFRFLVKGSTRKLSQQVEHLGSIAESLHIAMSSETTHLLAIAAEQFAAK